MLSLEENIKLLESLRLLAATPEIQLSIFPNFAVKADEIALVFDECYRLVPELFKNNYLQNNQMIILKELDEQFNEMSKNSNINLWTDEAVRTSDRWDMIRDLAIQYLKDSGEDPKIKPNLYWITYVRG